MHPLSDMHGGVYHQSEDRAAAQLDGVYVRLLEHRAYSQHLLVYKPTLVTLPADLAQQAGFEAGDPVEVVLTEHRLTLAPARDYGKIWQVLEGRLRYQAAELELIRHDKRDDAYWQVVEPMLQDLEQDLDT